MDESDLEPRRKPVQPKDLTTLTQVTGGVYAAEKGADLTSGVAGSDGRVSRRSCSPASAAPCLCCC